MKKLVKSIMIALYHFLNLCLPKDKHLAVISSGNGKNMGGNPGAIYEYAVKNSSGYRFVWFLTGEYLDAHPAGKEVNDRPGLKNRSKVVTYGHPAYYYYMARAGIWIFDSRQEPYIVKRPGVIYLQTWHGTPLKKLGLDLDMLNMAGEERDIKAYSEAVKKEAAEWDYLIAQNAFSHETFLRCFAFSGRMLDTGYPRNDILFERAGAVKDLKENEPCKDPDTQERKTILYAPTWRDDRYLGNGWYAYSSPLDFEELERSLGSGYSIIVRPHYLVKMKPEDIPESVIKSGFVRIASGEEDISSLYLASDAMITDYSSTMFDYSLLKRPMIFYVYDLEDYRDNLRGFYFDFEKEAPGPLCRTAAEVAGAIKRAFSGEASGSTEEIARTEAFRKKYNTYDDGNASRKVWEAINEV